MSEVDNLKLLLKSFAFLSGLQINFGKCELIGVQTRISQVNSFVRSLVVKFRSFLLSIWDAFYVWDYRGNIYGIWWWNELIKS